MNDLIVAEAVNLPDYTHSSNSLFHFMKEFEYLTQAIEKNALFPRYCREDIGYLDIVIDDVRIHEMAVLTKCFCDIPLHRITRQTCGGHQNDTEVKDKNNQRFLSHTDLYGEFALALSKSWGERKGVQPIQYINQASKYSQHFQMALKSALSTSVEVPEEIANHYLYQLAFIKPLRGKMARKNGNMNFFVEKNFHDEHEWRFVPFFPEDSMDSPQTETSQFFPIIANSQLLNEPQTGRELIQKISDRLLSEENKRYWLSFDYDDIRHIIVPNPNKRIELIKRLLAMSASNFANEYELHILISKIIVLSEIKEDW